MKRTLIAVAIVLATTSAYGQTKEQLDQAKALFNAGAQAYSVGEFLAAIQAFEEAYKIAPKPAILFSLAQAERRQYSVDKDPKRLQRAVDGFRKYVADVPMGGRRADAVQALGELEPVLEKEKAKGMVAPPTATAAPKAAARVMVTSPTVGAQVSLDGSNASEAPFIGEVKPGKHTVNVTATGHDPEKRDIQVVEGGLVALDLPLKEKPALLSVDAPSGAEIAVDGRVVGVAPLNEPISLSHGRHFVAVMKTGAVAWTRDIDVVRGETKKVSPDLTTSGQRKVAWVVIGTGVAALATGGVFTFLAVGQENKAQDILDEKAKGNIPASRLDDYDRAVDRRDRYRTWSTIGYTAGGALAITGILLYALDRPSTPARDMPTEKPKDQPKPKEPDPMMSAVPIVSPTMVGASFAIAF
jgi:hypothetical protein